MPAMLLLPLCAGARLATHLEIHAQRRDADLEVFGAQQLERERLFRGAEHRRVRERLARLFAGAASLDVSVSADARHARLLIPRH